MPLNSKLDPRMTVADLIKILSKMPKDTVVIAERYSDFVDQEPPEIIEVVDKGGLFRYERYFPEQYKARPNNIIKVCYFQGN